MIGGEQTVMLSSGCVDTGIVVHELMHVLGYEHEQNRADRDSFITVNFANVDPRAVDQFTIITADSSFFGTPYDINSVMQYGSSSFSINGLPTILAKDGSIIEEVYSKTDDEIMTASDILAVRLRYQCGVTTTITTLAPGVTTVATVATTRGPTTTPFIENVPCLNVDPACVQFAAQSATFCSTAGPTYLLNGRPFRDACRLMCRVCNSTSPCADNWYCSQFTSLSSTYCSTSGTFYFIDGATFISQCPVLCNTCLTRSAAGAGGGRAKAIASPKVVPVTAILENIEK